MGKCKKRTLSNITFADSKLYCTTRQEAVNNIIELLYKTKTSANGKNQRNQQTYKQAVSVISMFGITAEELSEAGAKYEDLLGLGSVVE